MRLAKLKGDMTMKYRVEIGSADDVQRDDEKLPSDKWESVASGETLEELVEFLLRAANDEELPLDNSWLRLVEDDTKVTTF